MKLGKYEIFEQIGKGGFGVVYRARDTVLDREVALKILHPHWVSDPSIVTRFYREAKATAKLEHPNIISIYDLGDVNGQIFIAMPMVDGLSLDKLIKNKGKLSPNEATHILRQILAALHYAHSLGFIHRDIKPSNILVSSDMASAKLADFGLVRISNASTSNVTTINHVMGSPPYIAPEIWNEKEPSEKSDIYSLGCVFYEMLTGQVLFSSSSMPATLMKHLNPQRQLESIQGNDLQRLTSEMLMIEPDQRLGVNQVIESLDLIEGKVKSGLFHITNSPQAPDVVAKDENLPQLNSNSKVVNEPKIDNHNTQKKRTLGTIVIASILALAGLVWVVSKISTTSPKAAPISTPTEPAPTELPATATTPPRSTSTSIPPTPTPTQTKAPTPTNTPMPTPPTAFKNLKYSAASGNIKFQGKTVLSENLLPLSLKNFDLSVVFKNPTKSNFDYGVIFAYQKDIGSNRLIVRYDGTVRLITYNKAKNEFETIGIAKIKNFNANTDEKNKINLYVRDGVVVVFINDLFVSEWNLPVAASKEGILSIVTESSKDTSTETNGSLDYSDLKVYTNESQVQSGEPPPTPRLSVTTSSPTSAPVVQPSATPVSQVNPQGVVISSYGSGYNPSGRPPGMDDPNARCGGFDDLRPVRQFQTRLKVENRTSQTLSNWKVAFIKNNGQQAYFCYYAYIPEIPPNSYRDWTFNAYIEESETITRYYVYSVDLNQSSNTLSP